MKRLLFLLLIIGLAAAALYHQPKAKETSAARNEERPEIGYQAPSFRLQGLDKKTYQLSGQREKPLVINFWASWCGPCREEAPAMRDIYLRHKNEVDFYAINATSNDDAKDAETFVNQFKLPFPVPMDVTGSVANLYQITAFPTTYLIDRQGIVRRQIIGMIEPEMFEKMLEALISIP